MISVFVLCTMARNQNLYMNNLKSSCCIRFRFLKPKPYDLGGIKLNHFYSVLQEQLRHPACVDEKLLLASKTYRPSGGGSLEVWDSEGEAVLC